MARDDWKVQVFFDSECPLCMREVRMLRRLDSRAAIRFTDIAAPSFTAERFGLDQGTLMAEIHARLPDGTVVTGVEVFRRLYGAVGLGWLLAWTRWPGLRRVADAAYALFARNRLRLTGRCDSSCELPPQAAESPASV